MTPPDEAWLREAMRLADVAATARTDFILSGDGVNAEEDATAALESHLRLALVREVAEPVAWGLVSPDGKLDTDLVSECHGDCVFWSEAKNERQSGWAIAPLYASAAPANAEARDAERLRALIRNTGREHVIATPGLPHKVQINLDASGCERFLPDGAIDFPATIRAILDDEIALQAAAIAARAGGKREG